jgi:PHD/YefM family antitoxin component YafN of YafNO toxin-antitoxin module
MPKGGKIMPAIRNSTDLGSKYAEISDFCHKWNEPVFITRNGEGDLAVMSIETYEGLSGRQQLYRLIDEGIADAEAGRVVPADEFWKNARKAAGVEAR